MAPVRIACVDYLNSAGLVHGLARCADIELIPAVPARIAGMVAMGVADVGLASIVDVATSTTPLAILPVGMIGCMGPTRTVRLFSRVPPERIDVLHADEESHTSVVLCQVILALRFGRRVRVLPLTGANRARAAVTGDWPDSVLLIGDKVVTGAPPESRFPHEMDLGQAWADLAGLPFVYAGWMCRLDAAESPEVRLAAAVLDRQRRRNAMRLGWMGRRLGPQRGWEPALADEYLARLLRFDLDPAAMQAVEQFLGDSARLGLLPPAEVRWVEPLPPPGVVHEGSGETGGRLS